MEEELDEVARGERAVGPAAAGVLPAAARPGRRGAQDDASRRLHDRGDRRGLLARATRWSSASGATAGSWPARMYPEHKESRPLPGDEPPPQEGTGEVCPECGEGTLVGKRGRFGPFVGCSRYPDCKYIKKDGPPPPDPLPFEVDLPQEPATASSCRVAHGAPGTSSTGAPTTRSATSRPTTSRSAASTTSTTARWRARARRRSASSAARPATRRRTTSPRASATPVARPIRARWRGPRGRPRGGGGGSRPERRPHGEPAVAAGRAGLRGVTPVAGDPATHPALQRFLPALTARDASPETRRAYATAVGAYLDWLAERGVDWRRPARADLRAYLAQLGTGAARTTVAQRLAAIRSFHRWAAREGLAPGDPWGAIATPRLPRRLPRVLEAEHIERLLATIDDEAADATVTGGPRGDPRRRPGPARRGPRRDGLRRRAAHQRAGRRRPRRPRPAARRDPGPGQGPQGAHRPARAGRPSPR